MEFQQGSGVPLIVGARHAKLLVTAESCGVAASAEMAVVVPIPGIAYNYFEFIACMRGPAMSRLERQVRELLDTVQFAGR